MWVICGEIVAICLTILSYIIGNSTFDISDDSTVWFVLFLIYSFIMCYVMHVLFYGPRDMEEDEESEEERRKRARGLMEYDSFSDEVKERLNRIDASNRFNPNDYSENSNRKKETYTMSDSLGNSNPLYKLFKFIFLIAPFGYGLFMLFSDPDWVYYSDKEWIYTLFKVLVIVDAIILVALRLHFKQFLTFSLSIATVAMCAMSLIVILSFSDSFDFSSSFWKFLDGIFSLIKLVLYIQIRKVESELEK